MQHDAQHESIMNIKQLRLELKAWGRYWARQEQGQGYASRSSSDLLGEVQVYGGVMFRELSVPKHIEQFDRMIERLTQECIRAIRTHYICKGRWALMGFDSKKSYVYWLRRAEVELTGNYND